jgi:hypothetical protein
MTNKALGSISISSLDKYIGVIIEAVQDVNPDNHASFRAGILGTLVSSLRHIRNFHCNRHDIQDTLEDSLNSRVSMGKIFVSDMHQAYLAGSIVAKSAHPTFFAHIPKSGGSSMWHQLASLLNQANLTIGSSWNVLDVNEAVEESTFSFRRLQLLLGSQVSNACELALKAPGKAVVHIHSPSGISKAVCNSNWITIFRNPEGRVASAFRHWARIQIKKGMPLDPSSYRDFWSDSNLLIKEWLQYNPSRHRVIVLNFEDIKNICGPFQGMLLGIGVPPVGIEDYAETKTGNDRKLSVWQKLLRGSHSEFLIIGLPRSLLKNPAIPAKMGQPPSPDAMSTGAQRLPVLLRDD